MVKETIKYFDFDGNERTETFCFNLTKAECMEMELSTSGGLENAINRIIEAKALHHRKCKIRQKPGRKPRSSYRPLS